MSLPLFNVITFTDLLIFKSNTYTDKHFYFLLLDYYETHGLSLNPIHIPLDFCSHFFLFLSTGTRLETKSLRKEFEITRSLRRCGEFCV